MTVDELYQSITTQKPSVIYISGKTSTGKSTFGRKLRDKLGYRIVELEAVLLDVIKEHGFDEQSTFRKVFSEHTDFTEKTLFLEATNQLISDALNKGQPMVIEGAIGNAETLGRILQPATNLLFAYFHPNDITIYIRNLTKRFMESSQESYGGLPLAFWQMIDKEEFGQFCLTRELSEGLQKSIARYAQTAQKESLERLHKFYEKFPGIIVVEI